MSKKIPRHPIGAKKAGTKATQPGCSRVREQIRRTEGWYEAEKFFRGVIEGMETKLVGSSIKDAMKRANLDVEREYTSCGRLCGRLTDGRRFSFPTLGRLIR
jgi:hypothetical protein